MKTKRILSLVLVLCLLLCLAPAAALAEEPAQPEQAAPPADETQDVADGYYLVGSMNNWTPAAAYKFEINPSNSSEYLLSTTLTAGQELKVVKVEGGATSTWYPGGNNYIVDNDHAGSVTIYFKPDYNSDWSAFGGYFYIAVTSSGYSISFQQPTHATLSADVSRAEQGETVTIHVDLEPGYVVSQFRLKYNDKWVNWYFVKVDASTYTFTMPSNDITITAYVYAGPGMYFSAGKNVMDVGPDERFTKEATEYGDYWYDVELTEGQELSFYYIQNNGSWSWSPSQNDHTVTAEEAGPARIYISLTEREGYTQIYDTEHYSPINAWMTVVPVTVPGTYRVRVLGGMEGCTVTADKTTAQEGETVTISITNDANHRLLSLSAADAEGNDVPLTKVSTNRRYTFTMPASDVTVTAVTAEIYPVWVGGIQVNDKNCTDVLGDGKVSYDPAAQTLTFSAPDPVFPGNYGGALIDIDVGQDSLTIEAPNGLELRTGSSNAYVGVYTYEADIAINGDVVLDMPENASGIQSSFGSVTINGDVSGFSNSIAIWGGTGVTVNGSVDVTTKDNIRTVLVSTGAANITGDFTGVGYGIDAKGGITVGGDVTIASSASANNYGLQSAEGAVSVGGNLTFNGKAQYAVTAAQGFSCVGNVTVTNTSGKGVYASAGAITVVSGTWDVTAVSEPLKAQGGIVIPDTHAITLPEGGLVDTVTESDADYSVVYEADGTTPATHVIIQGPEEEYAEVYGASISLKGNIGLNFYVFIPESLLADPNAYVALGDEHVLISAAETQAISGRTAYKFTTEVPAKEMGRPVTLKVYNGQDEAVTLKLHDEDITETGFTYSVRSYLDATIANANTPAKLLTLCIAMRDYGSCAQVVFGYDVENRAPITGDPAGVTLEDLAPYAPVKNIPDNSPVTYAGASVLLKSGAISDYTFTVNGQVVTPTQNGSYWMVEIPNIVAKDLDESYPIVITLDGEEVFSLEYSAVSYAYTVVNGSSDENLVLQAKALFLYWQAAEAYFAN